MAGVVALASETGSQQKVSLFQSLQLRFSNLRPSSKEPAQREKTRNVMLVAAAGGEGRSAIEAGGEKELTCPHAEQVLDIAGVDLVDEADVHGQDGRV